MSIKTATLNGVATIEIARPEKKNAITQAMYRAMAEAVTAATADPAVRAVLLTGQPGIFTSGNDIEDFMQRPPGDLESPAFVLHARADRLRQAGGRRGHRAAIGIGTTMLLHCDFVYVSDEARLAMPFVSLGLVPEFGSSLIVPQLMGNVRAADKLLLGEPFTGAEAVEAGIASAVLPAPEVVAHARRIAERFNALPPGRRARDQAPDAARAQCRGARDDRRRGRRVRAALQSPEAKEAFSAFFQKRKPDFSKF
jgi:enoyl-CoA hydratase/carnithine racemase